MLDCRLLGCDARLSRGFLASNSIRLATFLIPSIDPKLVRSLGTANDPRVESFHPIFIQLGIVSFVGFPCLFLASMPFVAIKPCARTFAPMIEECPPWQGIRESHRSRMAAIGVWAGHVHWHCWDPPLFGCRVVATAHCDSLILTQTNLTVCASHVKRLLQISPLHSARLSPRNHAAAQ